MSNMRIRKLNTGIKHGPGYCHFPEYPEEHFKQLTAEQLVSKVVKGQRRYEWHKIRERNERLDCRIYARAAASIVGLDRFTEAQWLEIAGAHGVAIQAKPVQTESKAVQTKKIENKPQNFGKSKRFGSFL